MNLQDELHALRNARRLLGPDWNRRIQAANLLGEAGAAEAVADLETVALENKQPELVKAAVRALGKIHAEAAVAALGTVLAEAQDEITAVQCLDLLLLMVKNGIPAACLALTAQGDRFFPILLNRAWLGEIPARQVILQMGEPGIHRLIQALLAPATRDFAASLLVEAGEAGEKPLMQALDEATAADHPILLDVLLRIGGRTRDKLLDKIPRT